VHGGGHLVLRFESLRGLSNLLGMTISLLRLPDGACSLEFATEDIDRVRAALQRKYGTPDVERYPTLTVYKFPMASLTFQNEWDDPCLISSSEIGVEMLEHLAKELG